MNEIKKNVKISIGILNRDGIDRLKITIPSILKQTYPQLEIVVFDNGSADDSIKYLKNYKQIRLVESALNLGYGKAKNMIVRHCTGKYILLLDNDIALIDNNTLHILLNDYENQKKDAFISPLVVDVGKEKIVIGHFYNRFQKNYDLNNIKNKGLIQIGAFRGGAIFFKKTDFIKLGGFDEQYPFNIDDYDLSARSYINGYSVYVDTNVHCLHHGVDSRTDIESLAWKTKYAFAGYSRMVVKNFSFKNLVLWLPLSQIWLTHKSFIISFKKMNLRPLLSHIVSIYYFVRDLKDTIKYRKKIQSTRKIKKDVFLNIKPL